MKRFGIILLAACLLLTSCGKGVKDIALTSFRLVSVSPHGLSGVTMLVEVGVDNPTVGFEITDVNAVLKLDSVPALLLTADQLMVEGRAQKLYTIPLKGQIAEGFNPFQLLRLISDDSVMSRLTADVSARAALRGGLGKNIEMKDIKLDSLTGIGK
ncbi:MAG: hypothetical protein ACI3Y1_07150 [Candidatus Cryptobacteroides sp.]